MEFPRNTTHSLGPLIPLTVLEVSWIGNFFKSRILQEEQRTGMRAKSALLKSEAAALISQGKNDCTNCKKYPHLNPHKEKSDDTSKPALLANQGDYDRTVCLMEK